MSRSQDHEEQGEAAPRYAAIYARVSTAEQVKNFSIRSQIDDCLTLAQAKGYGVPEACIIKEEGYSGDGLDRPGLDRLLDLAESRRIQAAIVWDIDRLSRGEPGEQYWIERQLTQAGVTLLTVHGIEGDSDEAELMRFIERGIARYERAKIRRRTRRGIKARMRNGHASWSAPLGYDYLPRAHGGAWGINVEEAALVRRIYHMYTAQGMGMVQIIRQLTLEAIPTKTDRLGIVNRKRKGVGVWSLSSLDRLLKNETYATGVGYFYRTTTISGPHAGDHGQRSLGARRHPRRRMQPREEWTTFTVPPLIDQAVFDAAQGQREQNRRLSKRRRQTEYLFTNGRARCLGCGRGLSGYQTPKRVSYYRCMNRHLHPTKYPECPRGIAADHLEEVVWCAVEALLMDPHAIKALWEAQTQELNAHRHDWHADVADEHGHVARLDAELERLQDLYISGKLTRERFDTIDATIQADRTTHLDAIRVMQERFAVEQVQEAQLQRAMAWVGQFTSGPQWHIAIADKRQVLESLGISLLWGGDGNWRLRWTIPLDHEGGQEVGPGRDRQAAPVASIQSPITPWCNTTQCITLEWSPGDI